VIGNEITIEVVSVSGEGVRLGISAPDSVSVHRFEVFEEIQQANEAAEVRETEVDRESLENLAAHLRSKQK
jgi:carbon storage regulator